LNTQQGQEAVAAAEDIDIEEISSSMPSDVADFVKELIRTGLRKFKIEKDVAQHVRLLRATSLSPTEIDVVQRQLA
jgi:hypothetical protein